MMIEQLVGKTIVLLNNAQLAHWQTHSYAEHEALGEFHKKLTELNDKLVEAWQGNQNKRIHLASGQHTLQNYTSLEHIVSEIVQYQQDISQATYNITQQNNLNQFEDIIAVLEDMAEITSQVQYHLSLK
jgi:hypothetical protein